MKIDFKVGDRIRVIKTGYSIGQEDLYKEGVITHILVAEKNGIACVKLDGSVYEVQVKLSMIRRIDDKHLQMPQRIKIKEHILRRIQTVENVHPIRNSLDIDNLPMIRVTFEKEGEDILCTISDSDNIIGIGISKAVKHRFKFSEEDRMEIAELRAWKNYYHTKEMSKIHE